jgi:ABC-2 type transport system ATP-binding protein
MPQKSVPVVEAAGLTKIFKDFWHRDSVVAVRDLDLDIQSGEVFGLLGPNGSGKSTTIKLILGLLYPTKGKLAVFGRPPTDVKIKSRIGYLPEESYLYRFLNARETLDFYGRLFQLPRIERRKRIDQILEMVGLKHAANRRVGEYSKGMARRIGLAQALINDPEFLILDEPTTGLDPIGTKQIKELILMLRDKGKAILLSSHLLADVEDVCNRVSILYGGQRRALGDINELLSRKELTQITVEQLKPETIETIRRMVLEKEGHELLSVSAPSDKLENLFQRIVHQAQAEEVETSGARTGELAQFLSESDGIGQGDAVIESLVSAAAEHRHDEPSPQKTAPREAKPQHEPAVVAELVDASAPTQPRPPVSPGPQIPMTDNADRGLIDSLLDQQDKKD